MEERTPFFTSELLHDKTVQKEFQRASLHLNRLTAYLHTFLIAVLLWFFWQMLFVLDAPTEFSSGMISLTVLYLIIEGIRFLTNLGGGIHYKRAVESNGGKPVRSSIQFYDTWILTINLDTDNRNNLSYDQIRSIYETRSLLLLGLKYRMFLIVDKKNLDGELPAFRSFLLEHCPNVKRKKIRSIRSGEILNTVKWVVILVLLFLAILMHPAVQVKERLLGQIHNGMEVSGILTELEGFGITCDDPEAVEIMYGSTTFFFGSRLESILHYIGIGEYDYDTNRRIPPDNGVYFLYSWADDPETMYTDLLEGIRLLDRDAIHLTDIRETLSESGQITVSFQLNGNACSLTANGEENRYDARIFSELNRILFSETGKHLYFSEYERIGHFIFFGDAVWADSFSRRTGLELTTEYLPLY